MPENSLQTVQLHKYVDGWQAGDRAAANQLCLAISQRMENLARRMLRGYPNVRDVADTWDVCQGASWRLLQTLRKLRPATTRDFYNLAATHIRRELLDLARHNAKKPKPGGSSCVEDSDFAPPAPDSQAGELELWTRFHESVGKLPAEEREVFNLTFYNGWTQPQIAELFDVAERTIRRRWRDACIRLAHLVGGQLPNE